MLCALCKIGGAGSGRTDSYVNLSKGKVKLSPCIIKHFAMKTYGGVEIQLQVNGQIHALTALPPGKQAPPYSFYTRPDGPNIRAGRCEEAKNIQPLPSACPRTPLLSCNGLFNNAISFISDGRISDELERVWKEAVET
jgi:hypothetical protein